MIVLPDVRGLHPYYMDLTQRFAEAGIPAVAIDYFGRTAGTTARDDEFEYMPHVQQVDPANVRADVAAAIERLRSEHRRRPGLHGRLLLRRQPVLAAVGHRPRPGRRDRLLRPAGAWSTT